MQVSQSCKRQSVKESKRAVAISPNPACRVRDIEPTNNPHSAISTRANFQTQKKPTGANQPAFALVPKLQLGNSLMEAPASQIN